MGAPNQIVHCASLKILKARAVSAPRGAGKGQFQVNASAKSFAPLDVDASRLRVRTILVRRSARQLLQRVPITLADGSAETAERIGRKFFGAKFAGIA